MATTYSQFCALARAAEVLGERWTLLIVRELMLGPKRFCDLKGRLDGVSASVLSQRLSQMEKDRLIERAYIEPPAASNVFQLTEHGAALKPAVFALIQWGGRLLMPPRPGERREGDWMRLAMQAYARCGEAVPPHTYGVTVRENGDEATFTVVGTDDGTEILPSRIAADVEFAADFETLLGLMSGRRDAAAAVEGGKLEARGDTELLSSFHLMFDPGR